MVLIATVIRLPFGTLGDVVYSSQRPVRSLCSLTIVLASQIDHLNQGIYPAIVILLVTYRGELNETVLFTSRGQNNAPADVSNLDTIEFGGNPHVNSSFRETETTADVTHNGTMVSHRSQA